MVSTRSTIEGVSGFLGVGSLEILGIFFILDGTSGFLAFVEEYANTNAWAVLVAVPLLVVAYVFGLISSLCMEALVERYIPSKLTPELFRAVSESGNEALIQKYLDAERHGLLLHGCVAAFLILAVGSWVEVSMMGPFGFVGYIGLSGGIGVAVLCPVLVRRIQRQVVIFSNAITGPTNGVRPATNPPNNGFNRTPESSGPVKPGEPRDGAG